ncbi:MAG: alpha/beta fold hydrolase [Pseudomonadota bacterium]
MSALSRTPGGTAWCEHGDPKARPLVLIHGLGLTLGTWDGHVDALASQYRVIRYDLAGHGASDAPARKPDLALYAAQLIELMDTLSIPRAAVWGFSLGGMINRRAAMDTPDRIVALGILNSPHERGEAAQALVEQRALDTAAGGPAATLDATLARWFTPAFLERGDPWVARVRDWVLANDHQVYTECRWVLANGVVELIRPEPPLAVPALVMTCEHDSGSTPAMSEAIGQEIAGSTVRVVPALQHIGLVEQPDAFTAPTLAFLNALSDSAW